MQVTGLLDLARDKFSALLEEVDKLGKHGLRVRVVGNKARLPADLQQLVTKAEVATASNNRATLNIALAYTGRDEITRAVRESCVRAGRGDLLPEQLHEEDLQAELYTAPSPPPDMFIRTSGETRLSDFLTWQASSR